MKNTILILIFRWQKKEKNCKNESTAQQSTYKITALESNDYIDPSFPDHMAEVVELTTMMQNNSVNETDHVEHKLDCLEPEKNNTTQENIQIGKNNTMIPTHSMHMHTHMIA